MRQSPKSAVSIALSPRLLLSRFGIAMLFTASLLMIIFSRHDNGPFSSVRTAVTDILTPVVSVLSAPVNTVSSLSEQTRGLINAYQQNAVLIEENQRLKQWHQVALNLETENHALRDLLHFVPSAATYYISAQIVSDISGPFVRSAIINAGSSSGVKRGQAVVNANGLVGRISEAGASTSRVLLLTDINSRVPVITGRSRERSILAGNNSEHPELLYLPSDSLVEPGEKLITSGDGGLLPKGLAVGEVIVMEDGSLRVKPLVESGTLDYVSVVDVTRSLTPVQPAVNTAIPPTTPAATDKEETTAPTTLSD